MTIVAAISVTVEGLTLLYEPLMSLLRARRNAAEPILIMKRYRSTGVPLLNLIFSLS